MQSDKQLKHWYDRFNKLYWGGGLPSDTILYWEPPPGAHGNCCPVFEVADGKFEIKLDPAIKGIKEWWLLILLHEMIHVALWPRHPKHQHGKLFQDEKLRLVQAGATKHLW